MENVCYLIGAFITFIMVIIKTRMWEKLSLLPNDDGVGLVGASIISTFWPVSLGFELIVLLTERISRLKRGKVKELITEFSINTPEAIPAELNDLEVLVDKSLELCRVSKKN